MLKVNVLRHQAWLEGEYPGIEQRVRAEGAEIHWGDETALVNTGVRGRSYAPTGRTPVAMAVGRTRQKLSMIATVTNQGKTRWMISDEVFDTAKLIEFLQALIRDACRKVFLILDNLHVHRLCCTSRKRDEVTPTPDAAMPWRPRAPWSGARAA
jgi:hypothetical protein